MIMILMMDLIKTHAVKRESKIYDVNRLTISSKCQHEDECYVIYALNQMLKSIFENHINFLDQIEQRDVSPKCSILEMAHTP